MFGKLLEKLKEKFISSEEDPLDSSKRMVNAIQRIVGILNVFGDKNTRNFTLVSIVCSVVFAGAFTYIGQFSQLVYLIQVFPDKILSFQAMNCFSATCVPLSKFIFMYCSRTRLRIITEMTREGIQAIPAGSLARETMMKILRKASLVSWLVILNQAFIHIVYLLIPFIMSIIGNDRYLPTTPGNIYGIVMKYESPYYEVSFALTCIATTFSAVNQTGYIVIFVTLLSHELGHFYAICETLNDIRKSVQSDENYIRGEQGEIAVGGIADAKQMTIGDASDNANDARQKRIEQSLRFCVKHHQFLFKLHEKVCVLYKVIFGTHFLIMIIVLVTTLQTLNSWSLMNTVLTGATGIMPLVVYCFGGEMLITAGAEMSEAIYSCGWDCGMKTKHSRVVLLMLCLSQHPLCYTAAGIFTMNRETFANVAQMVYKIYAVFN